MDIVWQSLDKTQRRGLLTTLAMWFLMQSGFLLLIPLFSIRFIDELGWSAAFIGLVLAVREFVQQGVTVFGGALADRFGAKGLIVTGVFIRTISFIVIGLATTKGMLMTGGVLAAIGGALADSPSRAMVAALVPDKLLPDVYARVGVLQGVARTVGPLLGALLVSLEFFYIGLVSAGFFFVGFLITAVFLPNVSVSIGKTSVAGGLKLAILDKSFMTFLILMMGFWFMAVQLVVALPLQVKALTQSDSSVGVLLTVNALTGLFFQIPLINLAKRYLEPLQMLAAGVLAMAVALGSVALVTSGWQLYGVIIIFALGTVLVLPNLQTVIATMANPQARGAYMGISSLSIAFGGGFGQILGGSMIDFATEMNLPAAPWVVSATVGLMAALGLMAFYMKRDTAVHTSKSLSFSGD